MISKTRITCDICGWSWKKSEGGYDLYICHKCYHDNENPIPSWDKMRFRTFEQFVINEDLKSLTEISKKWYDKPSKISKEILEIVDEVFPKKLMDAVTHIEPNLHNMMDSPPTVSNKGQSTGENAYKTINFYFKEPYGDSKITDILVGLRKGTSGRDTGYIAIRLKTEKSRIEKAVEYAWEPVDRAKKLYVSEFEEHIDKTEHTARQYGI